VALDGTALPAVSTLGIDYQQRSQVAAVDATYDIDARWSIGGKAAWRVGELRNSRDDSAPWVKASAVAGGPRRLEAAAPLRLAARSAHVARGSWGSAAAAG
jgi:hypothetical protein